MSAQFGKVLSLILTEHYGTVVEKVGTYLFQYGTSPILYIVKKTNLPLSKVSRKEPSTFKEFICI